MKLLHAICVTLTLLLFFSHLYAQGLDNAGLASTSASAAYSTRLVRSAYSGFCLQVRRSSDNAEANVAFDGSTQSVTANSTVTIAAAGTSGLSIGATMSFATFYASTSCFVTTWYDQSGNGRDAVQTTAAFQPRIVNAGVMDKLTGKAAITFQSTNQLMTYTASPFTVQTINAVRAAPDQNWQTLVAMNANTDFSVRGVFGGLYNPTPNIADWYNSTGSPSQYWVNGTQAPTYTGTATHTITANAASAVTRTMSISTTFLSRGMYGDAGIVELLLFASSLSTTDRQSLESNQNTNFTSLPLHLISFTGNRTNTTIHLAWQTAEELNTRHFVIERKTDNSDFSVIGQVPARGQGNGSYTFDDAAAAAGKVYYRLKMEDIDGRYSYSNTVTITADQSTAVSKIYPNPTTDKAYVQISDKSLLHTQAKLLDVNGKIITVFTINDWKQPVGLGGQPAGLYIVQLHNGEVLTITKK